jgi:hypothetical protein
MCTAQHEKNKHLSEVCYFVEQHGNDSINSRNVNGQTPLHVAVSINGCSNADLVHLLLEYGADPAVKDCKGKLPLYLAISMKCKVEVIKPLLTVAVSTSMTMDDRIDFCFVAWKLTCHDVTKYLMFKWGVSTEMIQDALVQKATLVAEAAAAVAAANKKKRQPSKPKTSSQKIPNKKRSTQEASTNTRGSSSSTAFKRRRQEQHHEIFGAISPSSVYKPCSSDDVCHTSEEDCSSECSEDTIEHDDDLSSVISEPLVVATTCSNSMSTSNLTRSEDQETNADVVIDLTSCEDSESPRECDTVVNGNVVHELIDDDESE